MVKTLTSTAWGLGLIPGHGIKIPHDTEPKKNFFIATKCKPIT